VCLSHIPELKKPHEITAEAQRVAQERLASAHWDEWQSYLRDEVERQVAEQLEFAAPEIRRIVLGGES
jgi:HEPN domain-containing protein